MGVIRIYFICGSYLVCKYVDLLQSKRVYPCSKPIPVDVGKYYIENHCLSHDTFMRFGFFITAVIKCFYSHQTSVVVYISSL